MMSEETKALLEARKVLRIETKSNFEHFVQSQVKCREGSVVKDVTKYPCV